MTDNAERQDKKLLHAKTGAAAAKVLFGSPENICSAIRWHTTGKADMTLLEKIIYLADYIEPTRAFEGLDRLSELAYSDLDAAMLLGCEMSISYLNDRGITPHRKTLEAIDWLQK
jgi:nicotinate-nucleotide adenylyltransferase